MQAPRHAFLSGWDALFLLIGLHFTEAVVGRTVDATLPRLGWSEDTGSAVALVIASAIVFTLAMRFTRTGLRDLFHPSRASPAATATLLVPAALALVPAIVLVVTVLTDWLVAVSPLSPWEEDLFESMSGDTLAAILLVCVLAPLTEEMLFRGLILRGFLARYPRWPAIVASAVLFGASHLNLYQFAAALLLGLLLGWLYERSRSLIPCIALHAAYNAAVTWLDLQEAPPEPDAAWWAPTPLAWVAALVLAAIGFALLARLLRPR
ncbi:MAG TPA: CPBP family intramembrane glutamic endopeptidase, partial [Ramlibacter sp.]|nr:CPBP family intramembrane glutamic endopeptidase [Ramlibacter sp.]